MKVRRDGETYVYHHADIELAVNVALITGRPLLIGGPSGCGKSSLALNVALSLGRRYYEFVVTNRSEGQDLLWTVDHIQRLNDAQVNQLNPSEYYVEPGVLWWAFDPSSAMIRGSSDPLPDSRRATDSNLGGDGSDAVVLIDEIDKADPDMPNSLLVPLGSMQFYVKPIGFTVRSSSTPLIIITTNNERELPKAFLRRCVTYDLPLPDEDVLVEIAMAVDSTAGYEESFLRPIARHVLDLDQTIEVSERRPTSTAEYIDTVRACHELDMSPDDPDFERLTEITLRKRPLYNEG